MTERERIKKAKQQDAAAFTSLMQSQMQTMYKVARSILQREDDVGDAIEETILTCWEKLATLKKEQYFKTWMIRILINHCNDILRNNKNIIYLNELPEIPVHEISYDALEWQEALHLLDEKYRLIVILYYVEGFRTKEISKILNLPTSTVRTRLSRARKYLKTNYYSDDLPELSETMSEEHS